MWVSVSTTSLAVPPPGGVDRLEGGFEELLEDELADRGHHRLALAVHGVGADALDGLVELITLSSTRLSMDFWMSLSKKMKLACSRVAEVVHRPSASRRWP